MFVTERDTRPAARARPTTARPPRSAPSRSTRRGEGGLLGLAAGPDGGELYAYLTTGGDNRVVRFDAGRRTTNPR